MTVRVPNERDNKGTVKVDVRLPDGFYSLSYKKVPGWKVKITRERLNPPVDLGEFSADSQVKRVVWTGNPKRGGIIRPDQFEEFPISVRVSEGEAGSSLVFRAFQTYRGGERVRWTNPDPRPTRPPRACGCSRPPPRRAAPRGPRRRSRCAAAAAPGVERRLCPAQADKVDAQQLRAAGTPATPPSRS